MPNTFIIAEAGVNHNGSLELAYKLCDAVKEAGADAVKFQTWITDKIMTKDNPRYDMIKQLEMPFDFFIKINKYCKDIGLMFLSTPDDEESLNFLVDELDMPIIKIGSGNAVNYSFIEKAKLKDKPLIISTGMCNFKDVDTIYSLLFPSYGKSNYSDLTLLHCTSLYPTPYDNVNLKAMSSMRKRYHCNIGYSDHTPGIEVPIAAVATGATVIEKHLTLDKTMLGPDHAASLEPHEFKQMVISIRNIEKAFGSATKKPCEKELKIRDITRLKGA